MSATIDAILLGDVVEHTNSSRRGCVVEVGQTHRDGTTEYRVRPVRDDRLGADLTWWNSAHVRRVVRRDPYRRYLALVAVEDDPARRVDRRLLPSNGRRHWCRRMRKFGPWLPDVVWEKMYWRLHNEKTLDASGRHANYDLGRVAWWSAAIDCLERRDRAERWWMTQDDAGADVESGPRRL